MCKLPKPKPSLWSRYSVTLVMIPSIIGMHYGWYMMQQNRALVSEEEQIDLPVITFAKYLYRQVAGVQGKERAIAPAATSD